MKTIKFIGFGVDYANVMTEEGESICKLRFGKDAYKDICMDGRRYLYLEGNDEPVAVFAKRFYYCDDNGRYLECRSEMNGGRGIVGIVNYTKEREVFATLIRRNGILWDILVEERK